MPVRFLFIHFVTSLKNLYGRLRILIDYMKDNVTLPLGNISMIDNIGN